MKRVFHVIWFVRWLHRLAIAILRRRKVIDLLPSFLVPYARICFDRRINSFRKFKLRSSLADYWSYDHCVASSALDLDKFNQGRNLHKAYKAILSKGRTPIIIDCGANIGASTYWFAVEFPNSLVIGIEPDDENIKIAMQNCQRFENVKFIKSAVASEDCRISLSNKNMGADAFRTVQDPSGDLVGYSISSLVKMVEGELGDLLIVKVDIEGFENELFAKNSDWVDDVDALIVEVHDWMLPGQAGANNLLRVISRKPRDFVVHGEHIVSFKL